MTLKDFFDFNHVCPVCGDGLNLFFQINEGPLFKGERNEYNNYYFSQYKKKNSNIGDGKSISLVFKENAEPQFIISDKTYRNFVAKKQAFFFYMCNINGFVNDKYGDYDISPYKSCYFRCSQFVDVNIDCNNHNYLNFNQVVEDPLPPNREETVCFKRRKDDLEKIYIFSLKSVGEEDYKAMLWFYKVTKEQSNNQDAKVDLFEKELPSFNKRLAFEDSDKLIERFDSWILLS